MLPPVIAVLLTCVTTLFRARTTLYLENLALRHRLAVYQQSVRRPRLRPTDRLFWVCLSRLWAGWQGALAFVQPRTVIAWQRRRFRDHWRCLSQRGTPGRPAVAKEVSNLIRAMSRANPLWGSPRIVGELRKLGIDELWPVRELAPGIALSTAGGMMIVTKAGGFGGESIVAEILRQLT